MRDNPDGLPLVAIVTPVYNGGNYLARTMQSVQAQTYPNLIHVVLNNASTDNTAEIIESFKGGSVRVASYGNDELLPVCQSWSKAFSYVPQNAVYAKLLCADDLMQPDSIARYVQLAEMDPEIQLVLSHDVYRNRVYRANLPDQRNILPGLDVARRILDRSIFWLPYHHFFVRIHEEDRGPNFCGEVQLPDPYVVLRSVLRGKFGYLHEPLIYTRWHQDSQTTKIWQAKDALLMVAHIRSVKLFGQRCWDESDYKRVLDLEVGRIARFVLRWGLSGQLRAAKLLSRQLASEGFRLTHADYIRYALGWPVYAIRKRAMRTPIGPRVDEHAFAAGSASGDRRLQWAVRSDHS